MACLPVMIVSLLLLGGGAFIGGFIGGWSPAGFGIGALMGAIMELIGFMKIMKREDRRSTDTGSKSGEKIWKAVASTLKLAIKYWKVLLVLLGAGFVLAFFEELLRMLGG